jgi:steroid delta-isomerase-like uncharacterized protein
MNVGYAAVMSEANKSLAREWFEQVWNQKSEAAIDRMFQRRREAHGLPNADTTLVGPDQFKVFHRQFCGAIPDLRLDVEDVIAEGDKVAVRWTASGTHLGDHFGFPASGRKAVLKGSSFMVFGGNQVVESWNQMDLHALFQKLQTPA